METKYIPKSRTKIIVLPVYSRHLVETYRKTLFVFGDNMQRWGKAGQAVIRGLPNVHGIATKEFPSMEASAFFNDSQVHFAAIEKDMKDLLEIYDSGEYDCIAFPKGGLGTGLSRMEEHSPRIFKWLNRSLLYYFGFNNLTGELYK